ncbi:hypothetical protein C8J56DRAFT_1064368 [Mycena floridula]|nr:hypothetical protein C8J56DRAFT_1064368 [Mycena floridula]
MDADLWASLSDYTNAQESMHTRLYKSVGSGHDVIQGLYGLHTFVQKDVYDYTSVLTGRPICYGRGELWKKRKPIFGRTHPERDPAAAGRKGSKPEGRGPDTMPELSEEKTKKRTAKTDSKSNGIFADALGIVHGAASSTLTAGAVGTKDQSLKWADNSCWLDASLDVIEVAFSRDIPTFQERILHALAPISLVKLGETMQAWQMLRSSQSIVNDDFVHALMDIRDSLRTHLLDQELLDVRRGDTGYQPALSWIDGIAHGNSQNGTDNRAQSYYQTLRVNIDMCTGTSQTGVHKKISIKPRSSCVLHLDHLQFKSFKGDVQKWLADAANVESAGKPGHCWLSIDGNQFCTGETTSKSFIFSLPLNLFLEISYDDLHPDTTPWKFPATLNPLPGSNDMIYDIVGRIFFSPQAGHFISRTVHIQSGESSIYEYHGMKNNGRRSLLSRATLKTGIIGSNNTLKRVPEGYRMYAVSYVLRGRHAAQLKFCHRECEAMRRVHNLQISVDHLDLLPQLLLNQDDPTTKLTMDKRFWLVNDADAIFDDADYMEHQGVIDVDAIGDEDIEGSILEASGSNSSWSSSKGQSAAGDEISETMGKSPSPIAPPRFRYKRSRAQSSGSEDDPAPKRNKINSLDTSILAQKRKDQEGSLDLELEAKQRRHSSPVDADFTLRCRCGVTGNGDCMKDPEDTTKCFGCGYYSHNACQVALQRKTQTGIPGRFLCDYCMTTKDKRQRLSQRMIQSSYRVGKASRIPFEGALALNGTFWYPCRRISFHPATAERPAYWIVIWWRRCRFDAGACHKLKEHAEIPDSEITDQLWGNFDGRREIRLGQWSLASNEASDEDILSQPNAILFTQEVNVALSPHRQALAVLFHDPDSVSPAEMDWFPALQQMKDRPLNASSDVLNFGGLSLSDCAQVNNWFDWNIPEAPNLRHEWIGGTIPIFHALTLLLAHRFHSVHIDLPDCPPDDRPLEQH